MLFGMNRVSGRVHIASSVIVAAGTTLSAFWILALNSWMQTPAGHVAEANGELIAGAWLEVIFNPSFPLRFTHMLLASGITAAFLVAGLSAWRLLRARDDASALKTLRFGAGVAAVLVPLQIVVGDLHGLNTLKHQPAKIAAMEALWETQRGAPLVLFALIDEETGTNNYSIEIPKLASLILTHEADGEVLGLDEFGDDIPPVTPVFLAFRVMVGVGVLMLLLSWTGAFQLRKRDPSKALLWCFAGMTFSGWIAVLAGWLVTEIGRQPWLVTGILRTAEAAGEASGAQLGASLTGYVLIYTLLLLSYMVVITHLARK
jgi:cytochrome d ubiquinol oxidase subunit I